MFIMIDMLKQMYYPEFEKSAGCQQPEKVQEQLILQLASLGQKSLKSQSQSTLSNRLLSKSQHKKELNLSKCVNRELDTYQIPEQQTKGCFLHKKNLEIYCFTDKIKVCPHCALFSIHRDHQLKPVKQVAATIRQYVQEFKQTMQRKQGLDNRLRSREFREQIISKIIDHKNILISQIKQKFKQIQQNIKLAEKRAFDDVAKSFKIIAKRIAMLDKQQQQNKMLYQKWESTCSQLLSITNFDQKAYLMATGGLKILKDGSQLLKNMQQKAHTKIQAIQQILSSLKVQQNRSVAYSIFNYLNITVEQQEQRMGKTIETEQLSKQQEKSQEIVQFNSINVIKEATSSMAHSRKRGWSSAQLSTGNSNRKSITQKSAKLQLASPTDLENIISQFCTRQNIETLDLSNSYLLNSQIYQILDLIKSKKKIKSLKLARNKLTIQGFARIIDMIPFVTNLNLSFNQLSQDSIYELLKKRQKIPHLRIVNLSNNGINQRRCQNAIEQLKKQGIIVTI